MSEILTKKELRDATIKVNLYSETWHITVNELYNMFKKKFKADLTEVMNKELRLLNMKIDSILRK